MTFKDFIGFGVAGNFTGHLEQAGEAADFVAVKTEEAIQPKAISLSMCQVKHFHQLNNFFLIIL